MEWPCRLVAPSPTARTTHTRARSTAESRIILTPEQTMRTLYSMLQYIWAFPATALGIALALLARTTGATCNIVEGVLDVGGGRIDKAISFLPRPLQFNAITLGHVVLGVDHVVLAACRAHEQVHVRQYERW